MKNILTITSVMIFCFTGTLAQTRSNLIILDYGTISDIAEIVDPDPGLNYRMVIDLKASSTDPSKINPGLNNIARLLNLHAAGGVQAENLNVVAAIHGSATHSVLDNTGYNSIYKLDNSNIELIRQLKSAGVDLFICGQSLLARNGGLENVNPDIKIALSMLTVVSEHQMKGYGLLVFD